MKLPVHFSAVKNNIELFSLILGKHFEDLRKKQKHYHYHGYIHRSSGNVNFEELCDPAKINDHDWKKICFRIRVPENEEDGVFEVLDEAENEDSFTIDDTSQEANYMVEQTLRALNLASKSVNNYRDLYQIFDAITHLEIEYIEKENDKDIIESSWFDVDRLGAEQLLLNNIVGTYLFRKDLYATILEKQLPIQCITLTYLAPRGKIVDFTLINKDERWLIFNDDLTFSGPSFPNISTLVDSLGPILGSPLY